MLLLLDNYDSFTYNLYQYLCELGADVVVKRNDEISLDNIEALGPDKIIVSPGPCSPNEAGISVVTITHFAGKIPILGVCLGHQAMGQAFGGNIVRAKTLMHGKTSPIHHDNKGVTFIKMFLYDLQPVIAIVDAVIDPGIESFILKGRTFST